MSKELLVFIESFRTPQHNELINTIIEGYNISASEVQLEGFGDTIRNTVNKVKTAASIGKETLFGSSEEQSIKNIASKTILNKNLYNSTSSSGETAIDKIVAMITNGTLDPELPAEIASIADEVLIDCLEDALTQNPKIKIIISDPELLRQQMDEVTAELADSVVDPLHKLGKMKLNDDRYDLVSSWWDKNVVPKMGKYYKIFNDADISIKKKSGNSNAPEQPKESTPEKPKEKVYDYIPDMPGKERPIPPKAQETPAPVQPKAQPAKPAPVQPKAQPKPKAQPQHTQPKAPRQRKATQPVQQ